MASQERLPFIKALSADLEGWGFYLCSYKDARYGRGGDLFVAVTLQDKTGVVRGRITQDAARLRDEFDTGEFVKVQARTESFNGRTQLLIDRIRRVNPDQDRSQGFRESDCVLASARPPEAMWAELQDLILHVQEPHLRELLQRLTAEHETKLRIWPAALTVHHAYRGGFLEHVLSVARGALSLGVSYGADKDMLVAGALLHDIGKLEELEYDGTTRYTREGNLVGHVTLGAMMVRRAAAAIPGFPKALLTQVEHLILSHHGEKEFGAPVEPMTVEAFILSAVDDLDATLAQVKQALGEDFDGEFTPYHSRLGRILWRG